MTPAVVKPISPYLQRPLRTLEQAQRDLETQRQDAASGDTPAPQAPPPPTPDTAGKPSNLKDIVNIGGKDVVIEPGPPTTETGPGSRLDVKA